MSRETNMRRMTVPELGSALGRLTVPATDAPWLESVRLALVTGLFEARGRARDALQAGRPADAREALGPDVWRGLWEAACEEACRLVVAEAERALAAAADESRLPARRRRRLQLDTNERHAIGGRLGAAGADLLVATEQLAQFPAPAWGEALKGLARRLEIAWVGLEQGAKEETAAWGQEADRVRAWRRPRWPLWLVTGLVMGLAGYLGLVLGGYLPVPAALTPLADAIWGNV